MVAYTQLARPAQLNCECDTLAKSYLLGHLDNPQSQRLPREPISISIATQRVTTDTGTLVRFHIGKQLARRLFYEKKILMPHQFDKVDWPHV